jgi:hypothetical protein
MHRVCRKENLARAIFSESSNPLEQHHFAALPSRNKFAWKWRSKEHAPPEYYQHARAYCSVEILLLKEIQDSSAPRRHLKKSLLCKLN